MCDPLLLNPHGKQRSTGSLHLCCAEPLNRVQPWEEATPNQTTVLFAKQYMIRDTETPILKQNVGMFKLRNGVEVHFQSFGIFNLTLWDDVMAKFRPLTKKDILYVGKASLLI